MSYLPPVTGTDPRSFGRRASRAASGAAETRGSSNGNDLRLFATTFAAGFLFVSIFLG